MAEPGAGKRTVISFFGVRGIGSFFYNAYAFAHADFAGTARLWGIVGLTIAMSVLLHGVTATPVMAWLDRSRRRAAERQGEPQRASQTPV